MPKSEKARGPTLVKLGNHKNVRWSDQSIPEDYSFVPKGNVYITRHCRDLTTLHGQIVYTVLSSAKATRIGLLCPTSIFQAVQEDAYASAEKRKDAVDAKDRRDYEHNRQIILTSFPSIPFRSLDGILAHGFEKGSGRVGRTSKLDESVKAELAVKAHIRHQHTDYDASYRQAQSSTSLDNDQLKSQQRNKVYKQVQTIADSWRSPRADTNGQESDGIISYSGLLKENADLNKDRHIRQRPSRTVRVSQLASGSEAQGNALGMHAPDFAKATYHNMNPQHSTDKMQLDSQLDVFIEETPQHPINDTYSSVSKSIAAQSASLRNTAPPSIYGEHNELAKTFGNNKKRRFRDLETLKRDTEYPFDDRQLFRLVILQAKLGGDLKALGSRAEAIAHARRKELAKMQLTLGGRSVHRSRRSEVQRSKRRATDLAAKSAAKPAPSSRHLPPLDGIDVQPADKTSDETSRVAEGIPTAEGEKWSFRDAVKDLLADDMDLSE